MFSLCKLLKDVCFPLSSAGVHFCFCRTLLIAVMFKKAQKAQIPVRWLGEDQETHKLKAAEIMWEVLLKLEKDGQPEPEPEPETILSMSSMQDRKPKRRVAPTMFRFLFLM